MTQEEETDLIRKAKKGDTAAFAVMIRRYQNLVYATAFQILKDTALAEDAAQESFVTAFRSLQDPSDGEFLSSLAAEDHKEPRSGVPQGTTPFRST